jgi:hypothetical protein
MPIHRSTTKDARAIRPLRAAERGALALVCSLLMPASVAAQGEAAEDSSRRAARRASPADSAAPLAPAPRKPWYERLSIRGYAQFRYNRLLETDPDLTCPQCDRSIGENNGFFLRRARLVISGDVHDRVSIYIQPDYASDAAGAQHYLQIRDAYFDVFLDQTKELRLRVGQSKVPFGWENLQSSSSRLPFDRADPLNSAVPNERDIGVVAYWAPDHIRRRFRILTDSGLKGTGDYGVVGLGVYNGQTANRPEENDNLHTVARVTYPFRLGNGQFIEASLQGYVGRFVVPEGQRTSGVTGPEEFDDRRAAASLVVYPQPFGLQAEWNVGTGPEFDPASNTIREHRLDGGYVQAMYRRPSGKQVFTPYARAQTYAGGKKQETDARSYDVREYEVGVEWLALSALELTAAYMVSDRRYEDAAAPDRHENGQLLRLQAQFNY